MYIALMRSSRNLWLFTERGLLVERLLNPDFEPASELWAEITVGFSGFSVIILSELAACSLVN